MLKTKITYITSDGTEFAENEKAQAIEYENSLLTSLTDVVCFSSSWKKTDDYAAASYIWIKSLEGIRAFKNFCKANDYGTIWEANSRSILEEKVGLYVWDEMYEEWFNLGNTITNLNKLWEDFLKNS